MTKHEVLPENIEIESIDVTLPPNATFARAGKIVHLFEDSIIISAGREAQYDTQSNGNSFHRPIEENTLIFSEAHQCIGRVFEIFGPVTDPLYIIRWPKETPPDLSTMKLNDPLYYCNNITHYLIPSSLKCVCPSNRVLISAIACHRCQQLVRWGTQWKWEKRNWMHWRSSWWWGQ